MKQKGKVEYLSGSRFVPAPERVLVTDVCRDVYSDHPKHRRPPALTSNGYQDGFAEYSTHLPGEYKFFTNQPSYGLSFLETNVKGPTFLHYPYQRDLEIQMGSGKFDVLCLSAYTWSLPWAIAVAEKAKKIYGFKEVWLGGYAVMTDEPTMNKYFDRLFGGIRKAHSIWRLGRKS